jgi:hypothetical protein
VTTSNCKRGWSSSRCVKGGHAGSRRQKLFIHLRCRLLSLDLGHLPTRHLRTSVDIFWSSELLAHKVLATRGHTCYEHRTNSYTPGCVNKWRRQHSRVNPNSFNALPSAVIFVSIVRYMISESAGRPDSSRYSFTSLRNVFHLPAMGRLHV